MQGLLREWDESFLPWSDDIDAITPRPQVKLAIDARLFGPKKPPFSLRSVFGLRVVFVGFAAVATLVIFVGPSVWNVPNGPQYIAEIAGADRSLVVTAFFDLGRVDKAHPAMDGGKLDEAKEAFGGLVVAGGDAAKLFQQAH
ncbi:MAG: anti-sigma-K factor RskA, partial [Paracoccaceae bacterium]